MTFYRKQGGSNVAANIKRREGSTWVVPSKVLRRQGGTWVSVLSALSVSASSIVAIVSDPESAARPGRYVSGTANVTVTGSSSYTVSWAYVSGSSAISCSNASALNPTFSAAVPQNVSRSAVWRVTVTDTASGQSKSVDVSILLAYEVI